MKRTAAEVGSVLLEGSQIVEYPDGPSMGSHEQIVFLRLNIKIVDGAVGQAQAHEVPMGSVIPRNISAVFETSVEHVRVVTILADNVRVNVLRQVTRYRRPAGAVIGCAEQVGFEVAEIVAIDCDNRLPWIVQGHIDALNSAPFRQSR